MSNTITPTVFYRTLNVEGAGNLLSRWQDWRWSWMCVDKSSSSSLLAQPEIGKRSTSIKRPAERGFVQCLGFLEV
jgi:hypothetical protein